MISVIHQESDDLTQLCQQFHVHRLEPFGSATRDDFDVLVEFEDMPLADAAGTCFGLLEALETRFGRPVDLVVPSAIRNPYFLESINRSRMILSAA